MMTLRNLTKYTPEFIDKMPSVFYLQTEDGLDWYYHLTKFQADTLKICFDDAGIIRSFHDDAARLYPHGLSVIEISKQHAPAGLNIDGDWMWNGKKIVPREYSAAEQVEMAEKCKVKALADAALIIAPLQDAVDIDGATDEEIALLKAWKTYRVSLNRLDLSTAPDITWPEIPA